MIPSFFLTISCPEVTAISSSQVAGMHEKWKGGNMELYPGGGHKLNLLRKEIELVKNETDLVVMFTDRY